jgi:hypothetical protein
MERVDGLAPSAGAGAGLRPSTPAPLIVCNRLADPQNLHAAGASSSDLGGSASTQASRPFPSAGVV